MPAPSALRGFVLQPTYRIELGRPVIHLYGRLEDGRSFLARDDREVPHFFVDTGDAERARELGAGRITPTGKVSLQGKPVARVEVLDSGTLALSTGAVRDPGGNRVGTFTSVWRREADGKCRIILDNGCPPCRCP
jgi:hypothetical protein